MKEKLKKIDKLYENFIKQLSRFSAGFISAGIWTSILCSAAGVIIMIVLLIKGHAEPTVYESACYIIKTGAAMLLAGTILALITEFTRIGNTAG